MNVIIRPAKTSDSQAISELIMGLAHHFLSESATADVHPFFATLTPARTAERIDSPNFSHYVAEADSKIDGMIALRDGSHLYHLFVRSDVHRRGIARELWLHAKSLSGHSAFTVNSSLFAVPVYERLGFVSKGPPQDKNGVTFVPMGYENADRSSM